MRPAALCLTALLVFLGERGSGRLRWLLWGAAAVHGVLARAEQLSDEPAAMAED